LGVERLLGLRLEGQSFRIQPCIPAWWPGYALTWRTAGATYEISVRRGGGIAGETSLDGRVLEDGRIPVLSDGGMHRIDVRLAADADGERRAPAVPAGAPQHEDPTSHLEEDRPTATP
jgi:cellobiose phosphorylase